MRKTNNETATATPATATPKKEVKKVTATKKKAPAKKKEEIKCSYDAEKNQFGIVVVKQTVNETGCKPVPIVKLVNIPKTAKVGMLENTCKLVNGKVFDVLMSKYNNQISSLETKKIKADSKEEIQIKIDRLKACKNVVTAQRKKLGVNNSSYVNENMCELLASYITGEPFSIDTSTIETALKNANNILDSALLRYMKGDTVTITKEEKETIQEVKKVIIAKMSYFTNETEYFNKFDISVSDNDVIHFYKIMEKGISKNDFEYQFSFAHKDGKPNKALSDTLVLWLLRKIKVTAISK